jgi:hypothetical protein
MAICFKDHEARLRKGSAGPDRQRSLRLSGCRAAPAPHAVRLRDAIGHAAARSDEAAVAEALEQAEVAAVPEYYPSSAAQ